MLGLTDTGDIDDMPVTPDTLKKCFEPINFPVYKDFASFFVSGVIGIRQFERKKCHFKYSTYVTVSDEAFAVLTLENNWMRWSDMAETGDWKESTVASKYTMTKDARKKQRTYQYNNNDEDDVEEEKDEPQARHFRGWSAMGIARYNKLFEEIELEQAKPSFVVFEESLMKAFEDDNTVDGHPERKRPKVDTAKALPVAKHELWDFDELPCAETNIRTTLVNIPVGLEDLLHGSVVGI